MLLICFTPLAGSAQQMTQPRVELLWPAGAPHANGDDEADRPSLVIKIPDGESATGSAVLVFPAGGYRHLTMDHEGHQVAEWLNSLGVAAIIATYRLGPALPPPGHAPGFGPAGECRDG